MKKVLIALGVMILASCSNSTTPSTPISGTGVSTIPMMEYPQTQSGSPAEKFCLEQGGTISHENTLSGTMDRIYCTTKDGQKVDAWQYLSEATMTGEVASGSSQSGVPSFPIQ